MSRKRDAYDEHMDQLVREISESIPDGTDVADVISACAAIMGYALADVAG